jgi:hypothetical protein
VQKERHPLVNTGACPNLANCRRRSSTRRAAGRGYRAPRLGRGNSTGQNPGELLPRSRRLPSGSGDPANRHKHDRTVVRLTCLRSTFTLLEQNPINTRRPPSNPAPNPSPRQGSGGELQINRIPFGTKSKWIQVRVTSNITVWSQS